MANVRFLADYDYKPTPSRTVAYKAGWSGTVKRECADRAVALGKAVELPKGSRPCRKSQPES
jgi:hypothetical protein